MFLRNTQCHITRPWSHTTTVSTGVPGDTVTPVHKSTLPLWSHSLVTCGLPTLPMAANSTNHGEEAILSCKFWAYLKLFLASVLKTHRLS